MFLSVSKQASNQARQLNSSRCEYKECRCAMNIKGVLYRQDPVLLGVQSLWFNNMQFCIQHEALNLQADKYTP